MAQDDTLGDQLRSLRLKNGKNLADLADATGCSITHVSRVERGVDLPTDSELLFWLEMLGEGQRSISMTKQLNRLRRLSGPVTDQTTGSDS